MSKMSKTVKTQVNKKKVVNFMGGTSYEINPIDTLKMVTASSIFGEPQYYRNGEFSTATIHDGTYSIHPAFQSDSLIGEEMVGKKTSQLMEEIIDKALEYDFKSTIEWAKTLREDFFMRLNPQVIMVRAAIHPARVDFNKKYPGLFSEINLKVMSRADEPSSQLTYYLYRNGKKNEIPGILKRNWSRKLSGLNKYQLNKYKGTGIGLIDTIRICHAHSENIDELMRTGTVSVSESDQKWETLKATGKTWKEILDQIQLGHMALLRNLRGIFTEIEDYELCEKLMKQLKDGVKTGKQFPFRYQMAKTMIGNSKVNHKQLILDTLEECMDIACENMPKLKGRTMCLSDNSGSAWGTFHSEYGSVCIADIGNLSSVITARNSDEGYVGVFGNELKTMSVSKRNGLLTQAKDIGKLGGTVGKATENGIWLFFKKAIDNREHWDNIFIYSDMQAGHGGLYGYGEEKDGYASRGFSRNEKYIDVAKLVKEYRKINHNVNVYCVQTAGYDNVLVPEYGYRTNIFYGWTGKELLFADTMNRFWDEKDIQKKGQP